MTKQIGFVGIASGDDYINQILNGPTLSAPVKVSDLPAYTNGDYVWEGGFLYTEVQPGSAQQTLQITASTGGNYERVSQDFIGGRPPR